MLWTEEKLKEIQRWEDVIFNPNSTRKEKSDAFTSMEDATHTYIKQTKPVSKAAPITKIGRCEYARNGELIGFYLEDLNK